MISRILCALCAAGVLMGQPAAGPAATARKALDLFLGQKYSEFSAMFTADMTKAIPPERLQALGAQIQSLGAPQRIGEPQTTAVSGNSVVMIPVKFAAVELEFRLSVDAGGRIAGFFMRQSAAPAAPWQRPAYSKPDSFREREVTVGNDEWKLPGTLTVPVGKGPFPGIVLVHGSGPNDRDETAGANKVFKDLAEGLASRGVAVLRYEKRTKQYGARLAGLANFTVEQETVEDAVRAAALMRTQPEVDPKRVYVLGHSLGGYLAPRIAQEDGKLAGIIIMGGSVRPLEDLMVDQIAYLSPNDVGAMREAAAKIKALGPGDKGAAPILNIPVSYWLDLKGYDPTALAKKLTIPILIVQGERDYQVTMKEFDLWRAALGNRKNVTMRSYPALNHLFVAGEGKSLPAEYERPGHVAAEVVEEIAGFGGSR